MAGTAIGSLLLHRPFQGAGEGRIVGTGPLARQRRQDDRCDGNRKHAQRQFGEPVEWYNHETLYEGSSDASTVSSNRLI